MNKELLKERLEPPLRELLDSLCRLQFYIEKEDIQFIATKGQENVLAIEWANISRALDVLKRE